MVDLQEIIQTIESMEDAVHLSLVAEAIDVAKRRKRRIAGSVFQEGDTVWVIQKTKRSKGVIKKMNYTRAKVLMEDGHYIGKTVSAPFTMLELRAE